MTMGKHRRKDCDLFLPGHVVHHIQAFRAMRRPYWSVQAEVDDDGWVTVTGDGCVERWWNHEPELLALLLEESGGRARRRTHRVLTVPRQDGHTYFYLAEHPTACVTDDGSDLTLVEQLTQRGGFIARVDPGEPETPTRGALADSHRFE